MLRRGLLWWRAQLTWYILRPNPATLEVLEAEKARLKWGQDVHVTGMHVRHGDKKTESSVVGVPPTPFPSEHSRQSAGWHGDHNPMEKMRCLLEGMYSRPPRPHFPAETACDSLPALLAGSHGDLPRGSSRCLAWEESSEQISCGLPVDG